MSVNIVTETNPPVGNFLSLDHWERGLDPWHEDAFPSEFKHVGTTGKRQAGWYGVDWCGNVIYFVADGTVQNDHP